MLDVEKWAKLRRRHLVDGVSLKRLARESDLSRNTVRRAVRADGPPAYRRLSKLGPFLGQVGDLLKRDPKILSVFKRLSSQSERVATQFSWVLRPHERPT